MLTGGDRTAFNYHPAAGVLLSKTHIRTEPDQPDQTVSYAYTPLGQLASRRWSRGVTTGYSYDSAAATTINGATLPGRTFGYAFDPIGNRTNEAIDGTDHAYTANELNQYTQRATPAWLPVSGIANRPGGAEIDINGQRLPADAWTNRYFYKPVDKEPSAAAHLQSIIIAGTPGSGSAESHTRHTLARPITEHFTYDLDGNLTSDSLWKYAYDGENRLKWMRSLIADENAHKLSVEFAYDYMGRRVTKDVYHYTGDPASPATRAFVTRTLYLYQGWTLLAEYSTGSAGVPPALIRRYTWGPDLSGTMGGAGDIGGLLAIEDMRATTQGVYHPAYDGNGNLMALAKADTGEMVAAYEYDPFGNSLRASGSYAKENPIRFSGKYYDNETGLTYSGFRYYSASLGRFINRDPLEERGGWNLYSGLKQGAADPYAGASGVEGTSWSTEWEQAQDRLLSNTSLPHTTQSVSFDGKRNSGLPGSSEGNQKTYSANATGHYSQGGAPGTGPQAPSMSVGNPAAGNADVNLYIYSGNNPINNYDALGLFSLRERLDIISTGISTSVKSTWGIALAAKDLTLGTLVSAGEKIGNKIGDYGGFMMATADGSGSAALGMLKQQMKTDATEVAFGGIQKALSIANAVGTSEGRQRIANGISNAASGFANNLENNPTEAVRSVSRVALPFVAGAAVSVIGRSAAAAESGAKIFCFPAGTLVLMADGSTKPIEHVKGGDDILSDNPLDEEKPLSKRVTHLHANWTTRLIHIEIDNDGDGISDGELQTTGEHPIWTQNRGWVHAKSLVESDRLLDEKGKQPRVLSVRSEDTVTATFNLSVQGIHTFFALAGSTPILVHNTNPGNRLYIVYQAPLANGTLYTGRASMGGAYGSITPQDVLEYRFGGGHHRGIDFSRATIREAIWGGGRGSGAYDAIRGAEQLYYERAGKVGVASKQISPIRANNPNAARYLEAAREMGATPCP